MHYSEISEQILAKGYYKTDGATPDATVNAQITSSIKHQGENSPFLKVSRGTFTIRDVSAQPAAAVPPTVALPLATPTLLKEAQNATIEEDPDESVIRCLGMYWRVCWALGGQADGQAPL